jgi:Skp family chaperone for outer membrane proteins
VNRSFLIVFVLAVAVLAGTFAGAGKAQGQTAASSKILVVDLQRALRDAAAVRSLQQEIEDKRQALETRIREQEAELREQENSLMERRPNLTDEEFANERGVLESRAATYQKEIQETKLQLDRLYATSMSQVQDALNEVIAEIAKERQADLVLSKTMVMITHADLDITDEALQRLNSRLPSVTLPETGNRGN